MKGSAPAILFAIATASFLFWSPLRTGQPWFGPAVSQAEEGWKVEYEAVCAKTDIAMTLSTEELKRLIAQCDRLKPRIELEDESTRKVYLRRLQMCRDLYKYVLESREGK